MGLMQRQAEDNRGGKSGRSGADHDDIGRAIPPGRNVPREAGSTVLRNCVVGASVISCRRRSAD
jgi:hypothetical protein